MAFAEGCGARFRGVTDFSPFRERAVLTPEAGTFPRRSSSSAFFGPPGRQISSAAGGLTSPIHSETAAAGDAVTGLVLREVKDRKLGIVARANDVVHGRILQLEHHMYPFPRWLLAIRFDTLEHDGVEQPLALKSRDGPGTFTFDQAGNVVIDQKFHSEWESR